VAGTENMSEPKRNKSETRGGSCAPAPCSVERTHRSVIERKLLTALEDDNTVAALLSKQDLEDMIAALYGYELGERKGNVLSWEAHMKRRKDLADSMSQLLREAFPPNDES
jgi:hypothetical protein